MNKKFQGMAFLFLFAVFTTSCISGVGNPGISTDNVTGLPTMACYKTFHEFAYEVTDSDFPMTPLLPTSPWQVEAVFSSSPEEDDHSSFPGLEVAFARSVNESYEIWLSMPTKHLKDDRSILVYQLASKEWQFIPDVIPGTDVFISDIYLTSDGTIWGRNKWEWGDVRPNSGPILSRFNEQTRQFEFAPGALEIPYTDEQQFVNVEIVVDQQDAFWLFVEDGGLYRYDPISQKTTKQIDLPGINGTSPVLSVDGSIYFEDHNYEKYASNNPSFSIFKQMLFQFIPETGELLELEIPSEPWPIFGGMFVTRLGQLWLGSVGYREPEGNWHLVYPDTSLYFAHAGEIAWISPNIMLESSNGILWFKKYIDSGLRNEGTAWYDPETGEGCMFTNIPANIIEDSQQQLWMFADGKLYRYSLDE